MTTVIDRRPQSQSKSVVNRQRFIQRHKKAIRKSVTESLSKKTIGDIKKDGADVSIPGRELDEPSIHNSEDGTWDIVTTGNKDLVPGDRLRKPEKGSARGGGGGGPDGDPMDDDFLFTLTKDEFADIFFHELELPNLEDTINAAEDVKYTRSGFSTDGTANNLHLIQSMRNAAGRNIALGLPLKRKLRELETLLEAAPDLETIIKLKTEIEQVQRRLASVGYIDPIDLRYRSFTKDPISDKSAVMFCIMDVSASMGKREKELAKRFFLLLYLFLEHKYSGVDIIFIRHTQAPEEVTEQQFFYGTQSGGTEVLPALEMMKEIIDSRYPKERWNIYGCQASDGDCWGEDTHKTGEFLRDGLLDLTKYFIYLDIGDEHDVRSSPLWDEYLGIDNKKFNLGHITQPSDVYPAFRRMFLKGGVK